MKIRRKEDARTRIHYRIRKKVQGTGERPRLSVFRSSKHLYVQVVDDSQGRTLVAASTREEGQKDGSNKKGAAALGKLVAARCREKGIENVVFDRGGFKYHGRIQVLADSAREAGLKI